MHILQIISAWSVAIIGTCGLAFAALYVLDKFISRLVMHFEVWNVCLNAIIKHNVEKKKKAVNLNNNLR